MVSVIIPVYNGAQFLEECLRSVMNQTYRDLEIIVIDDGSTDDTWQICQRMAQEDSRFVIVHQENAGVSAARNRGLDITRGEYITFVDGDDLLPPEAIESLTNAMTYEIDFVVGSHEMFGFGKREKLIKQNERFFLKNEKGINSLEKLASLMCAKLYRTEIIQKYDIRFYVGQPYGEDTIFNLAYCENANGIAVLSAVVCYCRRGGMASSVRYYPNINELSVRAIKAYFRLFDQIEAEFLEEKKTVIYNYFRGCLIHYAVNCTYKAALEKAEETLDSFEGYLSSDFVDSKNFPTKMMNGVLGHDEKKVLFAIYKSCFLRIMLKRIKRIYFTKMKRLK